MDDVIRLTNVSKRFEVRTHRATLFGLFKASLAGTARTRTLTALDGVSLTIGRGEKVGVVGGNGSGKSTLMRLVAGIFAPSAGTLHVGDRAAGILQAGAGMHRDLSAAENAELFGALLDLSSSEVRARLPEILDFAELDAFAHAPLREFSHGMVQRLAFSVLRTAAPPILLLDELLSGADARFSTKALSELAAARDQTLLFASHSLSLVERLCTRTLFLDAGRVVAFGPTAEVIARYRPSAG